MMIVLSFTFSRSDPGLLRSHQGKVLYFSFIWAATIPIITSDSHETPLPRVLLEEEMHQFDLTHAMSV